MDEEYIAINNDQTGYIDYTGKKTVDLASDLPAILEYNIKIIKNLLDIAMTRKILRGAGNVAVLCALSGNNSLQFHEGGSCALWRAAAATQFAIGRLKTKKEGREVPESATDVRDSLEVEKKEHDEAEATPSSRQDEDKFSKCECMESSHLSLCLYCTLFQCHTIMK